MRASSSLERRYRQLLACYPRAFRREHEEEMLAVLLAGARDGRQRPGLADSADLLRNAIWLRLRPGAPRSARTVVWAVKLMVLGACLELVALATVLATQGDLRSAIVRHFPRFTVAQSHAAVHAHVLPVEIGAPIAAAVWLWMAWGNGRGHGWARVLAVGVLALTSVSLLSALGQHAVTYAPADVIAGAVVWLVALLAVLLIFNPRSDQHYASRRPERRRGQDRPASGWPSSERTWRNDGVF